MKSSLSVQFRSKTTEMLNFDGNYFKCQIPSKLDKMSNVDQNYSLNVKFRAKTAEMSNLNKNHHI